MRACKYLIPLTPTGLAHIHTGRVIYSYALIPPTPTGRVIYTYALIPPTPTGRLIHPYASKPPTPTGLAHKTLSTAAPVSVI